MVNGLDDIGLTMQQEDRIQKYERKQWEDYPWIAGSGYMSRHRKAPVEIKAAPVPQTNRGEEKSEPLEW